MDLENLEIELRKTISSEDEIRQILAFVFTLHTILAGACLGDHSPGYFNKFIMVRASSAYEEMSEGECGDKAIYERYCLSVVEELMPKLCAKQLTFTEFLIAAKERITLWVCGAKQRIIDVSTAALEQTLVLADLDALKQAEIKTIFCEQLKLRLQENSLKEETA